MPSLMEMKLSLMQSRRFTVQQTKKVIQQCVLREELKEFLDVNRPYQRPSLIGQVSIQIPKTLPPMPADMSDNYSFNQNMWQESFDDENKQQEQEQKKKKMKQKQRKMQEQYEKGLLQNLKNVTILQFSNN